MKIRIAFAACCLVILQIACHRPWPPEMAARWDTGSVDLAGIERDLSETLDTTLFGEDLVQMYRETAQESCVHDHLLREYGEEFGARFIAADREYARRRNTVTAWAQNRIHPEVQVSKEEIEAFYAANPDYSHRPERRFVEHIFIRSDDAIGDESARTILAEVKVRFAEGTPFRVLAVEYSESETASTGGGLGMVSRGDLHETAEEAVFSLDVGEISRPIPVHGGLAVFVVTQVYPAKDFPLPDVRDQIAKQLRQDKLRQRLDEITGEASLPPDARSVPEDSLQEALQTTDPGAILYSDSGLTITVDEWRSGLAGGTAETQVAQYTDFLELQKVYHFVVAEGFLDEPGRRERIEERFEATLNDQLVNLIARDLLMNRATEDPSILENWYDENRERYQSPVELLVHLITAAPTDEVKQLTDSLHAIATNYSGGDLDQQSASILDATVSEAWVGIAILDTYHPRLKATLLGLEPPACAPIFNIANTLHLFCVEDRREPHLLSFDEARERVTEDYITANEQRLYEEIRDEILKKTDFEFNETRVREVLHAPSPTDE